jgi:hypothetical protein
MFLLLLRYGMDGMRKPRYPGYERTDFCLLFLFFLLWKKGGGAQVHGGGKPSFLLLHYGRLRERKIQVDVFCVAGLFRYGLWWWPESLAQTGVDIKVVAGGPVAVLSVA